MFIHIFNTARGKCPNCKHSTLFATKFKINDTCDSCGLVFQDNNDGTWFFLLMLDRAFFIFPLVVLMYMGVNPKQIAIIGLLLIILFIFASSVRMGIAVGVDYYFKSKLWK